MTTLFQDVHTGFEELLLRRGRVPFADFMEILFADDTVCCSKDPIELERLLHAIERVSATYGLFLNLNKCTLLRFGSASAQIHFREGTLVPSLDEARYLGCLMNDHIEPKRELKHRIAQCMT
eukprot:4102458-Prorocentrum_lima.AAC.1